MNAPRYVVTNGILYMTKCSGTSVGSREEAYMWRNQAGAENQADAMNARNKASTWHAELVEGPASCQIFDPDTLAVNSLPEFQHMVDRLIDCLQSLQSVNEMASQCVHGLSEQDKVQEDLLHKIEFESLGSGNGAHLCSLLQKCRQKRRGYKDMLTLIQFISSKPLSDVNVSELIAKKEKFGNRTYKTRTDQVF